MMKARCITCEAQLAKKGAEHEALLEMIPRVPNCVVAHSVLRRCEGEVPLEDSTAGVARHHDEQLVLV